MRRLSPRRRNLGSSLSMAPAILIVDDEAGIRESLSGALREDGYQVDAVASGEACVEHLVHQPADVVLLDIWLGSGMDGLEVLRKLQETDAGPMVVMISGHGTIETAVKATKLGAFEFLEKPLSLEKVSLVVKNAIEHLRLEQENRRLRAELDQRYQVIG